MKSVVQQMPEKKTKIDVSMFYRLDNFRFSNSHSLDDDDDDAGSNSMAFCFVFVDSIDSFPMNWMGMGMAMV